MTSTLPQVDVLMSTYNGAAFLDAQMTSILNQRDVDLRLIVRDDGSTDSTVEILTRWASVEPRVLIDTDFQQLGISRSFERLARLSDAPFFAFSDQDDLWYPNRLRLQVDTLIAEGLRYRPAMVCADSHLRANDDELISFMRQSKLLNIPFAPTLAHATVQNFAIGHTIVGTRELAALLAELPGTDLLLHDWKAASITCGLGTARFLSQPVAMHRVHAEASIGHATLRSKILRHGAGGELRRLAVKRASDCQQLAELTTEVVTTPAWHQALGGSPEGPEATLLALLTTRTVTANSLVRNVLLTIGFAAASSPSDVAAAARAVR